MAEEGSVPVTDAAEKLLTLATWLGELQRESRSIPSDSPPAHWIDLLDAFLLGDDPSSKWVQWLKRSGQFPDSPYANEGIYRRCVNLANGGPAPAVKDSLYTNSIQEVLRTALSVAAPSVGTIPRVDTIHILAVLVLVRSNRHERDLFDRFADTQPRSGLDAFRRRVAFWITSGSEEFVQGALSDSGIFAAPDGTIAESTLADARSRYSLDDSGYAMLNMLLQMLTTLAGSGLSPSWWNSALTRAGVSNPPAGEGRLEWLASFIGRLLGVKDNERTQLWNEVLQGESVSRVLTSEILHSGDLLERAHVIAQRTARMAPPPGEQLNIAFRHLIGALIAISDDLPPGHNPAYEAQELDVLRDVFLSGVAAFPDSETPSAWADIILGPMQRVAVARETADRDLLDFDRYARAFASVIADPVLQPPLAIGVFGSWGSGKSMFMSRVGQELRELESRARGHNNQNFCRGIVQISFNAWHYSETNLWACLFAGILEAIGAHLADSKPAASNVERGRVMSKLAEAERLEAEARGKKIGLQSEVDRITAALGKAKEEARKPDPQKAVQAFLKQASGWLSGLVAETVPQDVMLELRAFNTQINSERKAWKSLLRGVTSFVEQLKGWSWKAWAAVAIAAFLALVAPFLFDALRGIAPGAIAYIVSVLTPAVPVIAFLLRQVADRRQKLQSALADIQAEIGKIELGNAKAGVTDLEKQRQDIENDVARAASEEKEMALKVAQLRTQLESLEPRRQLSDFISKRTESDDYRKHLGLPSMMRKDLDDLTRYIEGARASEHKSDRPAVDRIVLFVDDLDRCKPEVVVRVLEAVHMLLSARLFVVVLGVDLRWIQGALSKTYPDQFDAGGEGATELEYIEKIFQVPFWIPSMTQAGRRSIINESLPKTVASAPASVTAATPPAPSPRTDTAASEVDRGTGAVTASDAKTMAIPLPSVRPVSLDPNERRFLTFLGNIAGDTPRRLKRFVSCYLILRASLKTEVRAEILEDSAYEPLGRLLAVAAGAPGLWPLLMDAVEKEGNGERAMSTLAAEVITRAKNGIPVPAFEIDAMRRAFADLIDEAVHRLEGTRSLTAKDCRPWLQEVTRFTFSGVRNFAETATPRPEPVT